jgi:predicted alpha-1,6-mannanase (GH76 family)
VRRPAAAAVLAVAVIAPVLATTALRAPDRGGDPPPRTAARAAVAPPGVWEQRADAAQAVLEREFGRGAGVPGALRIVSGPRTLAETFRLNMWWQAHAIDALADAQSRRPTAARARRIRSLVRAVQAAQGGTLRNAYFDDMGWMALALQRAEGAGIHTAHLVDGLWRTVRAGWTGVHGGGVAWRTQQPRYKNVPATAPAAILAARLGDARWAQRAVAWMEATLVDPSSGVVWDGIGRRGGDDVDRTWLFSYTHATLLGAQLAVGDRAGAQRTAGVLLDRLADDGGVLRDEGNGDGALFRGASARYLAELAPEDARVRRALVAMGERLWSGRDARGRFGPVWGSPPGERVELSAHLSGVLLLEALARLERAGVVA